MAQGSGEAGGPRTALRLKSIALGAGTMLLGLFGCLAFAIFGSWILLAAWLYGLPLMVMGFAVLRDGVGHRGGGESRTSPVARMQPLPAETKREVWARDGANCVLCGARGDLRFGYIAGDTDDDSPANLRVVCGSCERSLARRME